MKELVAKLPSYAQFFERLGISGPYRWIAGIEGVGQKKLLSNAIGGFAVEPPCLANRIVVDGSFTLGQDANAALYPFLSKIFEKCGLHPLAIPTNRTERTNQGTVESERDSLRLLRKAR